LDLPALKDKLHKADAAQSSTTMIADRFATRPAAEWVRLLAPAGAAVTTVNRGEQVAQDEHVVARGSVVEVGGAFVPANPVRMESPDGACTTTSQAAPPLVGDATQHVLAAAGFSDGEISRLQDANLI
jgi:crotonobetainyl-CoA:carnitine CoA-transferase CaiB-like acyl-CoA transferase